MFNIRRISILMAAVSGFSAAHEAFGQSSTRRSTRRPDTAALKSKETSPQESFAGLLQSAPSSALSLSTMSYGAGTSSVRSLTRSQSLAAAGSSNGTVRAEGKRSKTQAVGPKGFTPKEARLVVKENSLLNRQTVLIARLQKLESTLSTRAVQPTTQQLQNAEQNVVTQLTVNQTAIMSTLSTLSQLAPNNPAVQAEVSTLSAQATSIGSQAAQAIATGGFTVPESFPATASR